MMTQISNRKVSELKLGQEGLKGIGEEVKTGN